MGTPQPELWAAGNTQFTSNSDGELSRLLAADLGEEWRACHWHWSGNYRVLALPAPLVLFVSQQSKVPVW